MQFLIVFNFLFISINSLPFKNTLLQSNRHTEEEKTDLNSDDSHNLDGDSYRNQLPISHDNSCDFRKTSGERITHLKYILTHDGSTECQTGHNHEQISESSEELSLNDEQKESSSEVLNKISRNDKKASFNPIPKKFKLKLLRVIHRLKTCNDTGTFDLDCYKETKHLVNKIEDRVKFFNSFGNHSPSDTMLLQKGLDLFQSLEHLTSTLCNPCKSQWQYCFFFDFDSYAREVEEFYRSIRNLLQILLFKRNSPKPVLKSYQTVLEQKFRRYEEIISVETAIWDDRPELGHLKQLKAGAGEILGGLRRFWHLKKLND